MKYDAITIDTQTVEHSAYNFDSGLLAQLKQFINGPTQVILSQVVLAEIESHLRSKMQSAKEAVDTAHRKAIQFGVKEPAAVAFDVIPDPIALARARVSGYCKAVGGTIIPVDDVSVKEILRLYFKPSPPFSNAKGKKSEFPDAITLTSIEKWAKQNSKRVLAVSADGDWESFGKDSEHIDVVKDLAEALAKLQEHVEEVDRLAEKLISDIAVGGRLSEQFTKLLADAVGNTTIDGAAESDFHFEVDQVDAVLVSYAFPPGNDLSYRVVQAGPAKIVVDVDLTGYVNADGSFSFYVWDSTDHEYMGMGLSNFVRQNQEVELTILVSFDGLLETEESSVSAVEITNGPISIDFGYIAPDRGDDRDEEYEDMQNDREPFSE